jgi:hypothetical protein
VQLVRDEGGTWEVNKRGNQAAAVARSIIILLVIPPSEVSQMPPCLP